MWFGCVCVCVRERERDAHTHTHTQSDRQTDRKRERVADMVVIITKLAEQCLVSVCKPRIWHSLNLLSTSCIKN